MKNFFTLLNRQSNSALLLALLLLAAILHSGTTIKGGLYADDYIHRAFFLGSDQLEEKGLLKGIAVGEFWPLLSQQFNFFDPNSENYQALKQVGVLPWWTSEHALLHFYRPIATMTHILDYKLWPDNSHLMHLMNLLWYLLGLMAIYFLYKTVELEKPVIFLALLLLILDNSVYQVVTWVAARSMLMLIAFGFVAVAAYHKSLHSKVWYMVSLVFLTLALFSAEGAIGICAYLGAYMFTIDDRPWLKRLVHLLPFVVIVIVWRIYYQAQGFGAFGVDFYIDPGREPLTFLQAASYRFPGNFFELFTSIDIASGQIRADIRKGYAVVGIALLLFMFWLLSGELKQNKKLQFFALASLLALVPGLTIALAPRVMVLPFVGFAVVLAYILYFSATKTFTGSKKISAKFINGYTIVVNIGIAFVLCLFMLYNTADYGNKKVLERGSVKLGVENHIDKPVVVLNSMRPFWISFIAYEFDANGENLPQSVRVLSSAFFPIVVTREAGNVLRLVAKPAFQYDPEPLIDLSQQAHGHHAYLTQQLLGLERSAREPWVAGSQFDFDDMSIEVIKLYKGKPAELLITLKQPLEDYRFSYWDMSENGYRAFILPELGQSVELEGIFQTQ